MKDFFKNKVDELGIAGIVLACVILGACAYTAVWLSEPFFGGVTGVTSFIFLAILYLLVLGIVLLPVVMLAGFIGNILAFFTEGIIALRNYYKRA
ncbi:hypothetical protein A1D23_07490 [Chelonobacter oris]|uniref:hypothetical protein n=1 Tax=Chelonobacter oris TaxID=505317 RepID=UPI002447D3C0|nr:hypothetical protein [Chelonobacter oris]MDH2999931.1 hypothetical protein [Chelonobacter oris]